MCAHGRCTLKQWLEGAFAILSPTRKNWSKPALCRFPNAVSSFVNYINNLFSSVVQFKATEEVFAHKSVHGYRSYGPDNLNYNNFIS